MDAAFLPFPLLSISTLNICLGATGTHRGQRRPCSGRLQPEDATRGPEPDEHVMWTQTRERALGRSSFLVSMVCDEQAAE